MAAPFDPPTNFETKPHVPPWVPPPATKEPLDWAHLRTIELSLLDSPDPAVVQKLVETAKAAIKEDGFLYLTDYGVSLEQLHRQFSIAQYLHRNISETDKDRLHWNPESGIYSGYKPGFGWRNKNGAVDGILHFNFYKDDFASLDRVPTCIHPFMDEITSFTTYLTESVNRRLLALLSRVLELPDDYLWDNVQSHGPPIAEGYLRHALYLPMLEETKQLGKGLRMHGHCDFGTTTMLFSVPISSLQIWGTDSKWHSVKYNPGALVINIGETLELVSGGHFKATRHRVVAPPEDQMNDERLSIVIFNSSIGELRMEPAYESPLIQREGCIESQGAYKEFKLIRDQGVPVPTNRQWREAHIADSTHPTEAKQHETVVVNGIKMNKKNYLGVNILLPA
ncbi:hypothetical protein BCR39DRAFT_599155 [Naematelia encephala]|uniref:Fe2OG dioxygenase domain-containing protein n=1 Tax=Naematelia encephala TaxID=71784 RepID=A0A1Y2B291_9TREE|nr:hypothetical protein BCR39DRAFT_599155 [Naematelia encephala]